MKQDTSEQFSLWAERIKNSDMKAYSELYEHTYEPLLRYAERFLRSYEASRDIIQDVFVKLWNIREEIQPDKSLKAYLYQIVRNRSLNYIRDNKDKNIPIDNVIEPFEEPDTPEIGRQESTLEILMLKWISELPDRQREAFELSRFEGMSHQEIAELMELKARTVNNHIVLALTTLREKLDNYRSAQSEG